MIRKITPDGTVSTIAGAAIDYVDTDPLASTFYQPGDITIDKNGVLYITENGFHRVRKLEYK